MKKKKMHKINVKNDVADVLFRFESYSHSSSCLQSMLPIRRKRFASVPQINKKIAVLKKYSAERRKRKRKQLLFPRGKQEKMPIRMYKTGSVLRRSSLQANSISTAH